jgi:head-tail adaptor
VAQQPARVRSGQRKKKVTLQEGNEVLDPLRGRTQTWSTYATDWAAVLPTVVAMSETEATQTFLVQMRYRQGVFDRHLAGTQQRLLIGDYTLKLLEPENPELRNRDMRLYCAEATDE